MESPDEALFRNIVREHAARRLFTTALHKYYPSGLTEIEAEPFDSIIRLLRVLLTEADADRDF